MSPTKVTSRQVSPCLAWAFADDDWLGLDLTRQARIGIRRGEQALHVSKLRRGRDANKYAFVETITRDNPKVLNAT